jgi:hypothetical protein
MAKDVEHIFMCFLCLFAFVLSCFVFRHLDFFLWKRSVQFICPLLLWVIDFFGGGVNFLSSLYIVLINPLSDV